MQICLVRFLLIHLGIVINITSHKAEMKLKVLSYREKMSFGPLEALKNHFKPLVFSALNRMNYENFYKKRTLSFLSVRNFFFDIQLFPSVQNLSKQKVLTEQF